MKKLITNLGLLITTVLTIYTGLLIQLEYHMGNHGYKPLDKSVIGLDYSDWSIFHKISIIILLILFVFHILLHWKWYKNVISKRLFNKNRQVITLTVIFLLVAITGFIPWIIDFMNGNESTRNGFIEIHDKIAIILSIYFILHIIKRLKWFVISFERIREK
ncbi:DUF4405 domain-containing protein [Maribellus sp. CM-23]|uniref:DUF4405 domain-containing protein n=1 Tax=Maribellus sp. CM-23 TaxID=2781026 RepID=UPI001F3BB5C1|nr:DUF4405 domain-containing protein [Maribellus sp. CM-23]MCE4562760.1 DUF4405 domain-containing protein [Maribellus sp. CM-23]